MDVVRGEGGVAKLLLPPPPMMPPPYTAAPRTSDGDGGGAAMSSNNASASTSTSTSSHSCHPLPQSINYEQLFSLLSEYSAQHSGSFIIPTSHPTSHRIADMLNSTGVERVMDARWNAQLNKVAMRHHGVVAPTAVAQYTQYGGGFSVDDVNDNGRYDNATTLTEWFHEQRTQYHRYQQNLSNSLSSTRYHQLQTALPQFFARNNSISIATTTAITNNNYGSNNPNTNNTSAAAAAVATTTTTTTHPHSTTNGNGTKWEARLHELMHYQSLHGHTNVPLSHPTLLGIWVKNQRDIYHNEPSSMPPSRIAALDAINFDWNKWGHQRLQGRKDAWESMYNKLVEYVKKHGHGNVSQHAGKRKGKNGAGGAGGEGGGDDGNDEDLEEEERLGKWIKNQRYEYRKYHVKGLGPSRLGRDRIEKLNAIGFQWRLRPERVPWDDRFHALVEFKHTYGHCRVPMSIPELGKWAKYQRDQYVLYLRGKPSKMTPSKIDQLISIGFEDSIEERAVVVAAAASGLLTNGDDDEEVGGGVDVGGIGGGEGNRDEEGEEYEEEEDEDGGDKEDEEGESEYASRLDDSITYHHHQQQHVGDGHAYDAPQQQYPLPGGIGDVTFNSYGVGGGGSAQHSTQQSGLLDPFHYPQGEGGMHYSA